MSEMKPVTKLALAVWIILTVASVALTAAYFLTKPRDGELGTVAALTSLAWLIFSIVWLANLAEEEEDGPHDA